MLSHRSTHGPSPGGASAVICPPLAHGRILAPNAPERSMTSAVTSPGLCLCLDSGAGASLNVAQQPTTKSAQPGAHYNSADLIEEFADSELIADRRARPVRAGRVHPRAGVGHGTPGRCKYAAGRTDKPGVPVKSAGLHRDEDQLLQRTLEADLLDPTSSSSLSRTCWRWPGPGAAGSCCGGPPSRCASCWWQRSRLSRTGPGRPGYGSRWGRLMSRYGSTRYGSGRPYRTCWTTRCGTRVGSRSLR